TEEPVQDHASRPDAPRMRPRADRRGGDRRAHCSVLITRDRNATMGTREITSRTTAIAEPNPTRLASLTLVLVIRIDSSSSPFLPWLVMNAMSKARRDSIAVTTTITTLIGAITGSTTLKKVWTSVAPSTFAASRSE